MKHEILLFSSLVETVQSLLLLLVVAIASVRIDLSFKKTSP